MPRITPEILLQMQAASKARYAMPPHIEVEEEIQKPLQPFVRPPAVYSNKTPYGIASEMLQQQSKEIQ